MSRALAASMRCTGFAALLLFTACTVHHHHYTVPATPTETAAPSPVLAPPHPAPPPAATPVTPPVTIEPQPAGAEAPTRVRSFLEIGLRGFPITDEEVKAADAELARRFTPAKQFLIANKNTYGFYTSYLGRVGRPDELAPILEVPGGGWVLTVDRHISELDRHPEVVRLDASGAVLWKLALPTQKRFHTYETNGAVFAADGTIVVLTVPFERQTPKPSMVTKVSLDGRLVWNMRLREDKSLDGPLPQDMRANADGSVTLDGLACYMREYVHGTSENYRHWTGRVDATGRQRTNDVGAYATDWTSPNKRVFTFWHDLYRPYYGF